MPWLSEVLADPNGVADSQGEYIELRDSSELVWEDSLVLSINDKIYRLDRGVFAQKHYLILAPDSLIGLLPISASGHTPISWTLTNSSELDYVLMGSHGQILDSGRIPQSMPGQSWQRDAKNWQLGRGLTPWGDRGSPGWSGDSTDFSEINLDRFTCNQKRIHVYLSRKDSLRPWKIKIGSDQKFGDQFDVDKTRDLEWVGGFLDTELDGEHYLQLRVELGQGAPFQGQIWKKLIRCDRTSPLQITEIYPSPSSGQSEWIEIFNSTNDSMDLSRFNLNFGTELQSLSLTPVWLAPKKLAILARDTFALRKQIGSIRLSLIKPKSWNSLHNGTDSLGIVDREGTVWQQIRWLQTQTQASLCLEKTVDENQYFKPCPSSIGYHERPFRNLDSILEFGSLSISQDRNAHLRIWSRIGLNGWIGIYDLNGNEIVKRDFDDQTREADFDLGGWVTQNYVLLFRRKSGESQVHHLCLNP